VTPADAIESETLRLNRRYLAEVVERYSLCPWALRSRAEGHVGEYVFQQETPDDLAASVAAIDSLAAHPNVEVGSYPRWFERLGRLDFEHFARRLRALDADRHEAGAAPFAMAAFHPDASPHLDDPERLIPFLRRSPYPTLQLVRASALERVRGGEEEGTAFFDLAVLGVPAALPASPPSLRERIARRNLETVREVGVETVEAALGDIFQDRDRTDERLQGRKRA